ncbi:hypothetical protein E2C01_031214 [Portunus trituberculatus]|uniref:Uncharacterized protein n=1 Tax=Portunus trituberculatus TaxID=210409 RepID=A0A5B7EZG8_PORTR|nr:hypothetical protein [Portunus trituberculatus]
MSSGISRDSSDWSLLAEGVEEEEEEVPWVCAASEDTICKRGSKMSRNRTRKEQKKTEEQSNKSEPKKEEMKSTAKITRSKDENAEWKPSSTEKKKNATIVDQNKEERTSTLK